MTLEQLKARLRDRIRKRLQKGSVRVRQAVSAKARQLLREQPLWLKAKAVLCFAPLPSELDIWPLLQAGLDEGKQIALPRFDPRRRAYVISRVRDLERDIVQGRFGIREPAQDCPPMARKRLDLILVPGLAFDLVGGRLGRGFGYYDRLLARLGGHRCGVAFDYQIVARVPVGPQDMLVNSILTPSRWIELAAVRMVLE